VRQRFFYVLIAEDFLTFDDFAQSMQDLRMPASLSPRRFAVHQYLLVLIDSLRHWLLLPEVHTRL
jgi:hypothetical protein